VIPRSPAVSSGTDKGTGVVFLTVGATVAILSSYDKPKKDSRPLIFAAKNHLDEIAQLRLLCATEQVAPSALPSRFRASGSKGERWK
jgi:hypothetical protein